MTLLMQKFSRNVLVIQSVGESYKLVVVMHVQTGRLGLAACLRNPHQARDGKLHRDVFLTHASVVRLSNVLQGQVKEAAAER